MCQLTKLHDQSILKTEVRCKTYQMQWKVKYKSICSKDTKWHCTLWYIWEL